MDGASDRPSPPVDAAATTDQDVCFYDGTCPVCRRSAGVLRALDWKGRLDLRDMNRTPDAELPVSRREADAAMPMRTAEGGTLLGYDALVRALRQTPLGAVPGWILMLPGVRTLGRRAYAWFAVRRPRDGKGEAGGLSP